MAHLIDETKSQVTHILGITKVIWIHHLDFQEQILAKDQTDVEIFY